MKEQKKLEEECRQATEKLENYREQSRMQRASTDEVLRDVERAKEEFLELKKLREEEQDIREEYQEACRRLLCRELENDLSERCYSAMKLQGESCGEIEKLASYSRLEINKYEMIMKYEIDALDREVREAEERGKQLHQGLSTSNKRTEQWEEVLRQLSEEMRLFGDEVLQSADRQRRYQCLIESRKTKVEIAKRKVNNAAVAVRNGLVSAAELAKVLQQDLNILSSETTRKLQQNILQADNHRFWLDELKLACDNTACEQFQEIVIATDHLREQSETCRAKRSCLTDCRSCMRLLNSRCRCWRWHLIV